MLFGAGLAARSVVLFGIDNGAWRGLANQWLPARLDHFALGMLLAVLSVRHHELGREPRWARHPDLASISWGISIFAFWFLSIGFGLDQHRGQVEFSLVQQWWMLLLWGIIGVTAVAPATLGPQSQGRIRRALGLPIVAWFGAISYGIYLWHEAAIDFYLRTFDRRVFVTPVFEMTTFMLAMSIPIAALSYVLIERPILRLKDRPVHRWFVRAESEVRG
jgi:peptidoglycan/LPS O-acetylase OafA/YrhL